VSILYLSIVLIYHFLSQPYVKWISKMSRLKKNYCSYGLLLLEFRPFK